MHTGRTESTRQGEALALATLAFALCFAVWGLIAPLAPLFRELFRLSSTEVGILVATPVLLGSVARIPLGMLTDRFGGRVVFSVLMAFLAIPLALIGFASSYWALLIAAFWLGLAGSSFAVGVPFVSRWFPPQRQGFALGVYGMGNIGTALAATIAPQVAGSLGWPAAFWAFIPGVALMAVVFWLMARDAPSRGGPPPALADSLAIVRTKPLSWVLSLFYFVTFGGFVAISIFLPTLLVQLYSLDRVEAGVRAAGFVVLATLARPVGGYLADRIGGAAILIWVFVVIALIAVLLAFEPALLLAYLGLLVMAVALGLGNGAVFKLVPQFFPQQTGTVTGIVGAAGGIGGFFPPIILGFAKDTTGTYAAGFVLLAIVAVACLLINRRL